MILTNDEYLSAARQDVEISKTAARTTIAAQWFSTFDLAGTPGAGALAVGNTANGVVRVAGNTGVPRLTAFGVGATGYIMRVGFGNSVACRFSLYDQLFSCGAYAFNANTSLTSQPDFAGRVPSGDYGGLELWVEQVTAATGNQAVNVTYTDQDGNAGAVTGVVGIGAAPTVGRMWQLPLAAGDSGIQRIQTIVGSVATVGTFNVHVMRPLLKNMRVRSANDSDVFGYMRTGKKQIYDTTALFLMISPDSTSSGYPSVTVEVANR